VCDCRLPPGGERPLPEVVTSVKVKDLIFCGADVAVREDVSHMGCVTDVGCTGSGVGW
jgi:hypothetical protein